MTKQWAFVDRTDEEDNLVGSFEEIEIEDCPFADDPFGEEFWAKRTASRISHRDMGKALGIGAVEVSNVESGRTGLTTAEKQDWWYALYLIQHAEAEANQ